MTDFVSFPKIPRLHRTWIVSEKIDGTNSQIVIPEDDGPVLVGSRNRFITPENDNAGFARWVKDNEATLRLLGPGQHFGEWWGQGIQRRYGLAEKRFSLFNSGRWAFLDQIRSIPEAPLYALAQICHVVPVLAQHTHCDTAVDAALTLLQTTGSFAAPGFLQPEGVVAYHTASGQLFKVLIEGDDVPKGKTEAA